VRVVKLGSRKRYELLLPDGTAVAADVPANDPAADGTDVVHIAPLHQRSFTAVG
jgi:hypothetical protein